MMRIALGEIVQETGTFTPSRMGREAFEAYGLYQGDELLEQLLGVGPPGGFLQVVAERDEVVEVVPLSRSRTCLRRAMHAERAGERTTELFLEPLGLGDYGLFQPTVAKRNS